MPSTPGRVKRVVLRKSRICIQARAPAAFAGGGGVDSDRQRPAPQGGDDLAAGGREPDFVELVRRLAGVGQRRFDLR